MTAPSLRSSCVAFVGALAASAVDARGDDAPAPPPPVIAAPASVTDALILRIRGVADRPALAAAVAAELGVPVALAAEGAPCAAPCVDVVVDDRARATIVMVLAGDRYARTIELPAAAAAAAEVVALVVGNLARDQAGDLLAALAAPVTTPDAVAAPPAPFDGRLGSDAPAAPVLAPSAAPMPAPTAAPAPTPGPRLATHAGVGLVPPLAFDVERRHGPGGVTIDLVVGGRRRLASFNVAGVASVVTEDVTGTQIGGALTTAGSVRGSQIAGAIAAAGPVRGTQIAGAIAAAGPVRGTQIAGAITVAKAVDGAQLAGAVAVAGRDVRGAQVAGAVAIAGGAVDTQVAGAVNVAGRVRGLQVAGAVNVAGRVDGVQVGVVNVAGSGDGVSIGLLNVVRGGRTEVEATVDQQRIGAVVLRHGSSRWHNVYGVGGHLDGGLTDRTVDERDVWMYGLGMGPSWRRGATTFDLEAMAWHVVYGGEFGDELDLLNQLRLVVGHRVGPAAVVVGAAVNVYVTSDPTRDRIDARRMTTPGDDGVRVQVWPTAFVGVRL
ncbi:MAG: hypothetical protein IPL61_26245 [Myxococcales bacterium]|nr:hypothetical protein [Myxococcales bacterium]